MKDLVTPEEDEAGRRADAERKAGREAKRKRRSVRNTRQDGRKGEKRTVEILTDAGLRARLQPGSGAIQGLESDVVFYADDVELLCEVKRRKASSWKTLTKWMKGADMLVLILKQQGVGEPAPEPMVFMPERTLRRLINHSND